MSSDLDNSGECPAKRTRMRINVYSEHPENKPNIFRAAERRLKNNIVVYHEFDENEESEINYHVPYPVDKVHKAFHNNSDFLDIMAEAELYEPLPIQSQAWPIIMSGDDFIGIGAEEEDQRLAFLLPALLHIEKQRELRSNQKLPTVICVCATRKSALRIADDINGKFCYNDIKCVCVGNDEDRNTARESIQNNACEAIASTVVQLQEMIQTGILNLSSVSYLVLEKLDEILISNFVTQIKMIDSFLRSMDSQIIITSTTFCKGLKELCSSHHFNPVVVRVGSLNLTEINGVTQRFIYANGVEKINKAIACLKSQAPEEKFIVLCNNKATAGTMMPILWETSSKRLFQNDKDDYRNKILTGIKDGTVQRLVTNFCDLDMASFKSRYIFNVPKRIDKYVGLISQRSGDYHNITVIVMLSDEDWAIAPNIIAILRQMNQEVPELLYDLSNQFMMVPFLENPTFASLTKSMYFIDKSLFIKEIVGKNDQFLFTAPRKMGKTSNLNMLDCFFNINSSELKRSIFNNLKIGQDREIMNEHFGKYPVLWVDMSNFDQIEIKSVKNCYDALRKIIHQTYKRYRYLKSEDSVFKQWVHEKQYKDIADNDVSTALYTLAKLLKERYNRQVVLLCDEFDCICEKALSHKVDENTLDNIIRTYFGVFTGLVKTDKIMPPDKGKESEEKLETVKIMPPEEEEDSKEKLLYRAVFSGITAITSLGASPLNTLEASKFLESSQYSDFYGILRSEFDELLEKQVFEKLREEKDLSLALYNGYKSRNGRNILCTYSVVKYLSNVLVGQTERLKGYWEMSGSIDQYMSVWVRPDMQESLRYIVSCSTFPVDEVGKITAVHLAKLKDVSETTQFTAVSFNILMVYLQQLGYFYIETYGPTMRMRIPNQEIQSSFYNIVKTGLATELTIRNVLSLELTDNLEELIDVKQTVAALKKLNETLSSICKELPPINNESSLNESTFEKLILHGLFKSSKYKPLSQQKVANSNNANKSTWKILDLCFYYRYFGVVIELKCGPTENAQKAFQQIIEKKYYEIFDNNQLGVKIKRKLFVGIHVTTTEDCKVTSVYSTDIKIPPVLVTD